MNVVDWYVGRTGNNGTRRYVTMCQHSEPRLANEDLFVVYDIFSSLELLSKEFSRNYFGTMPLMKKELVDAVWVPATVATKHEILENKLVISPLTDTEKSFFETRVKHYDKEFKQERDTKESSRKIVSRQSSSR